jgi:ATP-dependent exoDNAse (exonuclease V) beta subunit
VNCPRWRSNSLAQYFPGSEGLEQLEDILGRFNEGEETVDVIDLLFEEEDGLVVVDYKTDTISENNSQEVLSRYRFQGAAYSLGVEKAISKPVKEVFLHSNIEETIVDLETIINELKSSIQFVTTEIKLFYFP